MQVVFGTIMGVAHQILGSHYVLFVMYAVMNMLDLLSGALAAHSQHKFSESKLVWGVLRKLGYWIMVAVAFGIAIAFRGIGSKLNVDLSVTTLIGWVTLSILLIHEARSILSHLVTMGLEVPKILLEVLRLAEKSLEDEEKYTGTMHVDDSDEESIIYRLELNCEPEELLHKDEIIFKVEKTEKTVSPNS